MSGLDLITLVVATIGAVTGVAALGWGIAQHMLSGARVRVSLVGGWFMNGGIAAGPLATIQRPNELLGEAVVGVVVRNVGRLPATVTVWGVKAGKLSFHSYDYQQFNPTIPHRVEAGEEATWYVPASSVVATVHASTEVLGDGQLTARVVLGTGKEITSKPRLDPALLARLAP